MPKGSVRKQPNELFPNFACFVQLLARRLGIEVPSDDALTAIDLIGQQWETTTGPSPKMTTADDEQRAPDMEESRHRIDNDDDHLIQVENSWSLIH